MQDENAPRVPLWELKTNSGAPAEPRPAATDARSTTKLQLEGQGETARLHLEMELPWKVAFKILEAVYIERRSDEATLAGSSS